jgi:beta-lactamase class A
MKRKSLEPQWMLTLIFLLGGIFFGVLGTYLWLNAQGPLSQKITSFSHQYKFINPLLAVDINENQFGEETGLQIQLQSIVDKYKHSNQITDASIYFRDIDPGLWVGINETMQFSPGRLLKIPIMIAYFKLAETDPAILDQDLLFHVDPTYNARNSDKIFGPTPSQTLVDGQSYVVSDLINRMIINSDGQAAEVLFDNIDKDTLDEVFTDLGINFEENKVTPDFISLKLNSLFYRVLYNATYLNREYSEKALTLLEQADNSIGLGASLPKDIPMANRFGAHTILQGKTSLYEMTDCGLVYYPAHPYLICALARGKKLDDLKNFLSDIGKEVYQETSYRYASR